MFLSICLGELKERTVLGQFRSNRLQMFLKIGVLKDFAIFTGKPLCWNFFLINLQSERSATSLRTEPVDASASSSLPWSLKLLILILSTTPSKIVLFKEIGSHSSYGGSSPPSLFKAPTPWPSLPPFLKFLFPLPSSVPPPFKVFYTFPPPSRNPLLSSSNQRTFLGLNKYQKSDFTSSTVAFYQKSIFNLLNAFTNRFS